MKRGLASIASAILLSACAVLWPAREPAVPAQPGTPPADSVARLAQLGHGQSAAFALCEGSGCPQVTPKSFALDGGTAPPHAPAFGPEVPRASAEAPGAPPDPVAEIEQVQVTVHFRFGDAALTPLAKAALNAAVARAGPTRRLRIVGRTDSLGAQAVNDMLAKARAHAVRDHLHRQLANWPATVDVESAGACCFATSNATPRGREANRRVEVTFSPAEPEEVL